MLMSRLMIVVEFEVKPEHRDAFVELMKGHARLSRAEDGCQQFDVLLPQNDPSRVLLVEAWRDQAALDVHAKLPRMAQNQENLWAVARRPQGDALHRGLRCGRLGCATCCNPARNRDRPASGDQYQGLCRSSRRL